MKNNSKKYAKAIAHEIKHEVLGEPKPKVVPPKRSAMDVILGKYPKTFEPEDQPSPIVEAMLQTKKSEEEKAKKTVVDTVDIDMQKLRQNRIKAENQWIKNQTGLMQEPQNENKKEAVLPSSPKKGAIGVGGQKPRGMEQMRKKN
ncbi:hypothetical protein IPM62_02490 [Candidatus Woesebacteria bacterium]|nr:MAG: hypothetical protein IPM62_02490 [Candidatus Woesebacteria bacterium]